jgi:hypothetical protein
VEKALDQPAGAFFFSRACALKDMVLFVTLILIDLLLLFDAPPPVTTQQKLEILADRRRSEMRIS